MGISGVLSQRPAMSTQGSCCLLTEPLSSSGHLYFRYALLVHKPTTGKILLRKHKTRANFLVTVHKPYLHHGDHMTGIQQVNDGPGGKLEPHLQPKDETEHHQQHILAPALLLTLGLLQQMTLQLLEMQLPELPQGQKDLHDAHTEEDQTLHKALLPREKGRAFWPSVASKAGVHTPVHPVQEIMEAVTRHGGTVPLLLPGTVQEQLQEKQAARLRARLIFGFALRCQDESCKQQPARREEPQMNGACEQRPKPLASGPLLFPARHSPSTPVNTRRSPLPDGYRAAPLNRTALRQHCRWPNCCACLIENKSSVPQLSLKRPAEILENLYKALGIRQRLHTPYQPQSSGQVERMNHTLKSKLGKICRDAQLKWTEALPVALLELR
ncbi:hypothetical protein QYF61_010972 [Mycteria americana]|uniref:Integrase catalytic domain-containing protein n=1 Tax=Mycteria americana TaxID=33587 RepID=A0AAN7RK88_MYCAM|nr:hypothetical protein QYF61_010972 [Mycteria americana]